MSDTAADIIGCVAIGRNEGAHLRRCLTSLSRPDTLVVYVDSGSTDGSVEFARSLGVEVVALDMSRPFSAARARNAGVERLLALRPGLRLVQFVDGDCEVFPGWLDLARRTLDADPRLGAAFGQRHEAFPEASVYNGVCELEWDTPLGPDSAFGGDAMIRVEALRQAGFYNPAVIASEDRDLWVRLRDAGWQTLRVDAAMTRHDARLTRFWQWWKRAERAGHAYGQIATLHAGSGTFDHHAVSQRRALIWGLAIPAVLVAAAPFTYGLSLLGFGGYAVPAVRSYRYGRRRGWSGRPLRWYAGLNVLSRFPEVIGVLRWHHRRLTGRTPKLIEYKGPDVDERPAAV